uniref:EGF-like domain-containing protein n=1 Tax=Plectus sambesii TaxID=2011161 RepID=A0A914V1C3_9BILA
MRNALFQHAALFFAILISLQCRQSNSESLCKNNGTAVIDGTSSWCNCAYPYTGEYCEDYDCANGLATGEQYDPNNPFFNKRCMCDSGWTGERCETSLFNRCGDNGAERKGNCICRQNYAGDRCQYVTICIHGQLFNGRCACYYGWSGDFCDIIVCHNGIPDEEGQSCKCASKYRGKYCDFCAEPSSSPPPECAEIGKGVVNIGQDYWPMLFAALITIGIVLLGALVFYFCQKKSLLQKEKIARQQRNEVEMIIDSTRTARVEAGQPLITLETPLDRDDLPPKYEDVVCFSESNNQLPAIHSAVAQDGSECKDIEMETLIDQADHVMRPHSSNNILDTTEVVEEEIKLTELQNTASNQQPASE